MISHEY